MPAPSRSPSTNPTGASWPRSPRSPSPTSASPGSAALWGEITIEKGRITTGNFDLYPIARIHQAPRVETHIIAEGDPIGGIGEPGTPPIAPAICNALLQLKGKPIRRLPIGRVLRGA